MPRVQLLTAILLHFVLVANAQAQRVRGLMVYHYSGQTFLNWESADNTVRFYTVYRSRMPLRTALALRNAEQQYTVRPGSATNHRLSEALRRPAFYRLPGPRGALNQSREYFVATTSEAGRWYYAVTATGPDGEFRQVRPGKNAVSSAAREYVTMPSPIHQGRFTVMGKAVDVFVHWATNRDFPGMPAMSNLSCHPFNFAVQKNGKAPKHPLYLRLHGRGDNFLNHSEGIENPQEYVLSLDDDLPGSLTPTFWFGYDRGIDINRRGGLQPAPGVGVVDYTMRRVEWTLEWALRKLPIDSGRVYAAGVSMGGSGVAFSLFTIGSRVAAGLSVIPRLEFRQDDSTETPRGRSAHRLFDALWGEEHRAPKMTDGRSVYEVLDFPTRLRTSDLRRFPPLRIISGRKDDVVGWRQVRASIRDADSLDSGIAFFWDDRGHSTAGHHPWSPQRSLVELSRYRGDRSWPAFSRVSANASPDHISPGNSNAAVTWYEPVIDESDRWSVGIRRAALEMRDSVLVVHGPLTADVTPRRLQHFAIRSGSWYDWSLTLGREEIARGRVRALDDGDLTISGLKIPERPSRLEIRAVPGPVLDR